MFCSQSELQFDGSVIPLLLSLALVSTGQEKGKKPWPTGELTECHGLTANQPIRLQRKQDQTRVGEHFVLHLKRECCFLCIVA